MLWLFKVTLIIKGLVSNLNFNLKVFGGLDLKSENQIKEKTHDRIKATNEKHNAIQRSKTCSVVVCEDMTA